MDEIKLKHKSLPGTIIGKKALSKNNDIVLRFKKKCNLHQVAIALHHILDARNRRHRDWGLMWTCPKAHRISRQSASNSLEFESGHVAILRSGPYSIAAILAPYSMWHPP